MIQFSILFCRRISFRGLRYFKYFSMITGLVEQLVTWKCSSRAQTFSHDFRVFCKQGNIQCYELLFRIWTSNFVGKRYSMRSIRILTLIRPTLVRFSFLFSMLRQNASLFQPPPPLLDHRLKGFNKTSPTIVNS